MLFLLLAQSLLLLHLVRNRYTQNGREEEQKPNPSPPLISRSSL